MITPNQEAVILMDFQLANMYNLPVIKNLQRENPPSSKGYRMKSTYRICRALPEHLSALPEIERSAAAIFPTEVLSPELHDNTTPIAGFDAARLRGLLWVAVSEDGQPVGFAIASDHGDTLHLEELDVHPDHQRRGIGRALMDVVCTFARESGYQGITLTTFVQIPWNAPWYKRLGFRVLKEPELSSALCAILKDEAKRGLDPQTRVAMLKRFSN